MHTYRIVIVHNSHCIHQLHHERIVFPDIVYRKFAFTDNGTIYQAYIAFPMATSSNSGILEFSMNSNKSLLVDVLLASQVTIFLA